MMDEGEDMDEENVWGNRIQPTGERTESVDKRCMMASLCGGRYVEDEVKIHSLTDRVNICRMHKGS